jgi:RNA polymerase sigma-70 factor, ECF subfamily
MLRIVRLGSSRAAPQTEGQDELLPLAEAAALDDAAALRTLLSVLGPHLLRVVRRVIGANHPDVEDVAQECALEFVSALRHFRRESSVKHFASRVALRASMNARRRLRASKRSRPEGEIMDADDVAGSDPGADVRMASRASVELARELCEELPPAQSEVLALHCILGYTMSEVAAICEAPLETVRSRLRTARQALMAKALEDPRLREYLEETA